ncbi:MAG TPA: beta-N-acetylhexosaminidase [Candidatus Eisenbacteria bacterium]|nr:beta-N-acetylhexosaminidase [Candidatus Eisenbacteria bacterium]
MSGITRHPKVSTRALPALVASAWLLPSLAFAQLRIIPDPSSVQTGSGRLALTGAVTIAVGNDAEDRFAAELLGEEIRAATGKDPRVVQSGSGTIVLRRDGSLAAAGDEGYRLEVKSGGVTVTARTAAGLFYGVQTLRQMIEPAGIPVATIEDRPAMRWRGVHDDISRGPVPTVEALKRRIAILAEFKVNLYALYSEQAIAYRSEPLVANPGGAFTPEELRDVSAFASRHHVALMIEQQVFGHLDRLLGYERYKELAETPLSGALAPANPKSLALAETLLTEAASYSSAPFVHVGGDEMTEIGKGQSRELVAKRGLGNVYVDWLARLDRTLAARGKRTMFWGDFIESHPEVAARLPKSAVAAVWDYSGRENFESRLAIFRNAGVDVFVCPGAINWSRIFPNLSIAIPNIRGLTREGQKKGALGQLTCTWDDNGDALFGLCWYPVLYGAAAAWKSGDYDPERFRLAFDWAFLRSPGHEAADAVASVASAHTILQSVRPMDATIELSWLNPARGSLDRRLLGMIGAPTLDLRRAQEQAIEQVERARVKARRNADQLDYVAFAARRLHAIGQRAILAERLKAYYQDAFDHQKTKDKSARVVDRLNAILGLIAQGREQSAMLRDEYQRLWLAENRPYWLGNVLAEFDRDLQVWAEKWDRIRVALVEFRNGTPLPAPEALGLGA